MRTRRVDKFLFRNYLVKAGEFNSAAKTAFERSMYNATVVNAVHSAISSVDALAVFYKGVRHAGERHEDALALLQTLPINKGELNKKTRQLSRLLAVKTAAEYNEQLMTKKDGSTALMDSDRILEWVNEHLDLG